MPSDFDMDIVGVLSGTDKSSSESWSWDYLRHYQEAFAPWRDAAINVIEIGVQGGSSLDVWRAFFTRATLVGVDINPACAAFADERVTIEIGSQDDPGFLHRLTTTFPPTIIIDDGSHLANHVVYTFEHLFPALLPGGLYVVEDMAFHFGDFAKDWAGDGSVAPSAYFGGLIAACLARDAGAERNWGTGRYIFDAIDSITAIHSALIIRKRKPRDVTASLAFARQLMAKRTYPAEAHTRLAAYLLRYDGPLDTAEEHARKALAGDGATSYAFLVLSDVLLRRGAIEQAGVSARQACKAFPQDGILWRRLADIEGRLGNLAEAAAATAEADAR